MTRAEFEAGIIQREGFTPATASCVSGYLFDDFPDAQLRMLASPVTDDVPQQMWGTYAQVVVACQYHDELGVAGPPADEAAP